jgi:branched-chain amino acid transport system substrate-binding protein
LAQVDGAASGFLEFAMEHRSVSTNLPRRSVIVSATASVMLGSAARAQSKPPIRIGLASDMTGPFADFGGPGAVIAAHLAAEEFANGVIGRPIEILSGDHQNKPDIASSLAREWMDAGGVEAIIESGHSGSALALQKVTQDKSRIFMITGASTSELTNKACSPVGFHFNCDTFALARITGDTVTKLGGASWFFVTVDYAFGQALERDTRRFVEQAGGKVLGAARHPLGTSDFSSYLIAAQTSGADVVAFASAGADAQNAIKQAAEFGMTRSGQRLAALLLFVTDVMALGLDTTHGLTVANSFYWDLSDATRAWTKRFMAHKNQFPTMNQAASYACVRHYLNAVQIAGTTETTSVAAAMRATPVNDMYNDNVPIRADGRVLSKMYLMQVKSSAQSAYRGDVYKILSTTPGKEVFRPLAESECPLVKT